MNAYELAKYIEDDIQIQEGIADMLREQADRIAELEKQGKPVAWMSPDGKVSQTEGSLFYIPLFTTPQTKPLSDGVILNSIPHPRNDGYVPEELNSDSLEMVEIDLPCVLTIDEIHNLFGITALNPTVTLTWEQCEKIARAIEERHGIK